MPRTNHYTPKRDKCEVPGCKRWWKYDSPGYFCSKHWKMWWHYGVKGRMEHRWMTHKPNGTPRLYIEAAACCHDNRVYSLPPPARHHNVLSFMYEKGIKQDETTQQGFITNHGKFVDRKEALEIASIARQLIRKTPPAYMLFSEDLW